MSPLTQGGSAADCVSVGVMYVTVRDTGGSMVVPSITIQSSDAGTPLHVDMVILP